MISSSFFTSSSQHTFTYGVARVSNILPTTGSASGGLLITVFGVGFDGGSDYLCRFSTVSVAANFTSADGTLRCLSPPRSGTEMLTVEVSLDAGVHFTYDGATYFSMAPVLSLVTPQSSPIAGGSRIKLLGSDFGNNLGPLYRCSFGDALVPATHDAGHTASGAAGEALFCDSPNSTAAQAVNDQVSSVH